MNSHHLELLASGLNGSKIGGFTIIRPMKIADKLICYEVVEDAGYKRLLYLYTDESSCESHRPTVRGFRTSLDDIIEVGGSKLHVYINVGEHKILMPDPLRQHLMCSNTMPTEIDEYEVEHVLGSGFKGVTFRVHRKNGLRTPYALKLTTAEEYQGKSWGAEVDRMVALRERDSHHFPHIFACGTWTCQSLPNSPELIFFVEEFIPGITLGRFLEVQKDRLSTRFLEQFVREMLGAISSLQDCELMHDDLHADNIMLRDPLSDCRPMLIDFGSAKPIGPSRKERDDIRNFATHTARMVNLLETEEAARTRHEEQVLKACGGMLAKISDDDPMRRPDDASEILEHFKNSFQTGEVRQTLQRPFDFGNAEEILDNELLYDLAAKHFPWRDKIESSANLLIIGPRGCGKTTVFRSMSFNCLADAGRREEVISQTYFGLYISCNKEFRQRFSALDGMLLSRRAMELRHYFNLLVIREFVTALTACHSWGELGETDVNAIQQFLDERAGIRVERSADLKSILSDIQSAIVRCIYETRVAIIEDVPLNNTTEQSFVTDLAELANERITPFLGKVLYLFIDDYTEGKVSKEAQKILNHILFLPNALYKTKVSAEVFGVVPDQTFSTFLEQDRDYKEWNLGTLYYANLPSEQQKAFLREIIDKRLELCKYVGKVEDIIGPSEYFGGTLARALKYEAESRQILRRNKEKSTPAALLEHDIERELEETVKGGKCYYHGWETICQLCTGDISNILEILSRMYEQCDVKKLQKERIAPRKQDDVIQTYSRQHIEKIKTVPQYGGTLFEIVNAFGSMSRTLLQEHEWINRGQNRRDPYQLIRIEMDEGRDIDPGLYEGSEAELHIKLWLLLQRRSIFIDAEKSRSRRNTLASKVILRRIFCPSFRIALTNSESYTINKHDWATFCADPLGTAKRYVQRVGASQNQITLPFDGRKDGGRNL